MKTRSLLQLYSGPSGAAGEHGFRLTGRAKEGAGLCRVQLRYMEPWHRYPSPRLRSTTWDLRVYTRTDAGFVLETELGPDDLETLEERYEFPDGAEALSNLQSNGDLVHDRVLAWAQKVTGANAVKAPTEINPVLLDVRYSKAAASSAQLPRIPRGRPLPPGQSPLVLNSEKKELRGSGLTQPAPAARPASPAPNNAAAKKPARPPASTPKKPAAPPVKPPAKPTSDLSERLSALRKKAEETPEG